MKIRSLILVILLLGLAVFTTTLVLRLPKKDATAIFAEHRDPQLGDLYVVGRYDGFPNGWNVAFFHKDTAGEWSGYYLAHESLRWNPQIQVENGKVIVWEQKRKAAEYQADTGTFRHHFLGVTYPKPSPNEGMGPKWWGLN